MHEEALRGYGKRLEEAGDGGAGRVRTRLRRDARQEGRVTTGLRVAPAQLSRGERQRLRGHGTRVAPQRLHDLRHASDRGGTDGRRLRRGRVARKAWEVVFVEDRGVDAGSEEAREGGEEVGRGHQQLLLGRSLRGRTDKTVAVATCGCATAERDPHWRQQGARSAGGSQGMV